MLFASETKQRDPRFSLAPPSSEIAENRAWISGFHSCCRNEEILAARQAEGLVPIPALQCEELCDLGQVASPLRPPLFSISLNPHSNTSSVCREDEVRNVSHPHSFGQYAINIHYPPPPPPISSSPLLNRNVRPSTNIYGVIKLFITFNWVP